MPLIERNRRQLTMDRVARRSLGYVTARWYDNGIGVALDTINTDNRAPDTLYAVPILLTRDVTLDRIAVEITNTSGSGLIYAGIYNNVDGIPATLAVDAGSVSMTPAGVRELTIAATLTAGWYWLSFQHTHGSNRKFRSYNYVEGQADLGFATASQTDKSLFLAVPSGGIGMPASWPAGHGYPTDRPPRILIRVA